MSSIIQPTEIMDNDPIPPIRLTFWGLVVYSVLMCGAIAWLSGCRFPMDTSPNAYQRQWCVDHPTACQP